jgi:hypothetical protein
MTRKKDRSIWIFGDYRNYFQNRVTLQLLSRANELAGKISATVAAVVFGNDVDEWVGEYIAHGARKVYVIEDQRLENYSIETYSYLMDRLADYEKVHVIVSNAATTVEAFGQFGGFSTMGPFFNVQTKTLDMHIRPEQIAAVFAVEKPGHLDGVTTLSIQFYDLAGSSAFKVFLTFGQQVPSDTCRAWWSAFHDEFALAGE